MLLPCCYSVQANARERTCTRRRATPCLTIAEECRCEACCVLSQWNGSVARRVFECWVVAEENCTPVMLRYLFSVATSKLLFTAQKPVSATSCPLSADRANFWLVWDPSPISCSVRSLKPTAKSRLLKLKAWSRPRPINSEPGHITARRTNPAGSV